MWEAKKHQHALLSSPCILVIWAVSLNMSFFSALETISDSEMFVLLSASFRGRTLTWATSTKVRRLLYRRLLGSSVEDFLEMSFQKI